MTEHGMAATARALLEPLEGWALQCHAASVHLVRSGRWPDARVARGSCEGVGGQHSWVVLGDRYDKDATIIDPTMWSYQDGVDPFVWTGSMRNGLHVPHGSGSIWRWGRPENASGREFKLTPRRPWSEAALKFLELLGPLDQNGWITLAHAPVEAWPAGEIIDAMCESGLEAYVPIDRVGMLTDRNPQGLYLPVKP